MRSRPALLLLVAFALAADAAGAEPWQLWPSPTEDLERLDQRQLADEAGFQVRPGEAGRIGQTFVAGGTELLRIDLKLRRRGDGRPGQLRLWRWRGDRASTVGREPLFEDAIELTGTNDWQFRSFFPRLDVERRATYYLELAAEGRGPFVLRGTRDSAAYPDGSAFGRGRTQSGKRSRQPIEVPGDLWFRTWFRGGEARPAVRARLSGPARPFHAPRPAASPVEAADYCRRVQQFADYGRPGVQRGCGKSAHKWASYDAALYRRSCRSGACEEAHAAKALALLRRAHAYHFCTPEAQTLCTKRACDPERPIGFEWLLGPGFAWTWLQDSPSVQPEDRRLVRELLLSGARRFWERRERGSFNRAQAGALGLRLVAEAFPDAPEAPTWRAWSETVWSDVWVPRDTNEDSASYTTGVWWPAVLGLARHTGRNDAVWRDPSFRSLVEREFDRTLPLGASARYGDDVGWAFGQPGLVLLFETSAEALDEPTHRWLARRVFDYQRRHARDDPPEDDSLLNHMLSLARACIVARDGPASAPKPLHEQPMLVQTRADGEATLGAGQRLGQSFVVQRSPLARIDLRARGAGAEAVARASLYRWQGDRARSTASTPLWAGSLPVGAGPSAEVSLLPLLPVTPGATYYLELEPDAGEAVFATGGGDPLASGTLLRGDAADEAADLWLRVSTLAGRGSVVTTRRAARARARVDWGTPRRLYDFESEQVPDKLVLRSGFAPTDFTAVFNLLAGYGHGQPEIGALATVTEGGAALLTQTAFPYARHSVAPQDESVPLLRRWWGGEPREQGRRVVMSEFQDARDATFAAFRWQDVTGWGVEQERRVLFVRNRFLWVRDRFRFPAKMGVSVGPIWHAGDVHAVRGANGFDLFLREPLGNVWKFRNPERYLLAWFLPRPGTQVGVHREPAYGPPPGCEDSVGGDAVPADCRFSPEFVAFQRWRGETPRGSTRSFDTLLVPHGPEAPGESLAAGIRVLHDAGRATALRVRLGDETWIAVDNPDRTMIDGEELRTDARTALSRSAAGRPPYLWVREAREIRIGEEHWRWRVPSSEERGARPAASEGGP